jgi:small subunit ribosomal protein S3
LGQKVSPIGFRVGVTEDWKSRWFAPKSTYGEFLVEDQRLRRFIAGRLNKQGQSAGISQVQIDRTRERVEVNIHTARPGMVIGARGAEIEKLEHELEELTDRKIKVRVTEIKRPDLTAQLIVESIAEQLKKRVSFRRAMKQRCESAMNSGAKGIKIICSGRLGGAEIARSETQMRGSIPLQTLQANIDYGSAVSRTSQGTIGVKVWIYKGEYGAATDDDAPNPRSRSGQKRG